ncbi:DUF6882 domain-containing protein [Motilimonas pumila]|uniref:Uncharacterized protein n=1 Tax=Motilimonas pumila TaxID=2303987 RepID=A0A418YG75_9GAMM|nr:DUF6882 domain-containing protein [Motilimonas pumila]RJG48631.1 hypothetical protein D1Z90_07160 [Motilimonas pumila]
MSCSGCHQPHSQQVTYLCQHLIAAKQAGFNTAYDEESPDVLYPDAWCDKCLEVLMQQGEWNQIAEDFAAFSAHCSHCYHSARQANWRQDDAAYHQLVRDSFHYLQHKQADLIARHDLNQYDRWDWDQASEHLIFSLNGQQQLAAQVSFSGSISSKSNTWMWAWANTSLLSNIKAQSKALQQLGEANSFLALEAAIWPADETDGWEMTAVMAKHLNAIGAYRTKDDSGFTYMVIHSVSPLS